MKLYYKLAVLIVGSVLVSCNSTKIVSSWKADGAPTKIYHNVMVWGILPENDSSLRKQIENHLVNDLTNKGYHAISSLEVYKSKAYTKLTSREIIDEFKNTGVDAVITLVLLDKQKEEKYYPALLSDSPVYSSENLGRYYSEVYEKVFSKGYYLSTMNYFWEAGLFDVAADKLIYSVRTRSFDQTSTEILAHDNGQRIMKDMMKKKIIIDQVKTHDE